MGRDDGAVEMVLGHMAHPARPAPVVQRFIFPSENARHGALFVLSEVFRRRVKAVVEGDVD